jgi:putative DNA primase/helicase
MSIADQAENLIRTDEDIIRELAELPPLDYDRCRAEKAKELGCQVRTLDKLVEAARSQSTSAHAEEEPRGRVIEYQKIEPWPEAVDMAVALDEARQAITRHMFIRDDFAVTAALWAAHAHVFEVFSHTPRLGATAPDAECGKTLLMQLVGAMVPKPQPVEIMKAAPFFRLAEQFKPTFLIDECDVFIKEDTDLLAAINNGWEPHGGVPRCVGDSSNMEVRLFSTHTPVVVGGIKLEKVLPATTQSRTLMIALDRATPGEIATPFDKRKHRRALLDIGRKFARWTGDNLEAISKADPVMPNGAFNRRADKWRPLFAIAELAGGKWPSLAKKAYCIEEGEGPAKVSTSVQLLADIHDVWPDHKDGIHTEKLIQLLCEIEESRWIEYNFRAFESEKKRIQPKQLADLLRDYKVNPTQIWDGKNRRGFKLKDLKVAWNRYIPPDLSARTLEHTDGAAFSDFSSARTESSLADKNPAKPTNDGASIALADKSTPVGQHPEKPASVVMSARKFLEGDRI